MRFRITMAVLVLFGWAAAAPAQEPALDLLPHDAGAALAVRNIKELAEKGDKFAKEMNLRNDVKFTQLFEQMFTDLGVQGAVDKDAPAAILAVSSKSIGLKPPEGIFDANLPLLFVVAVPFKDADQMAAKVGLKKGELKEGQVFKVAVKQNFLFNFQVGAVRGKHLYIGMDEKAVKHAATDPKRFGAELSAGQRKHYGQSDLVLQLGTFVWGKAWDEGILKAARRVLGEKMDAKEKVMGEKIVKAMEGIRFGLAGLRLEKEGLNLSLLSTWDKSNKNVEEVLGLLRCGDVPTDLKGLPTGNVLHAEAAIGNGVANAMLARVLFKASLQEVLGTDEITTNAERPMVVGVFNEVWYNLVGNKSALYQNAQPKQQGAVTMISILDTADGKKFFDHMAHLAKIADGGLKPGKDGLNVDQLVKDLVSSDARKHELALLKLRLLGEPALPALKKATAFKDKQLSEQAKALFAEITKVAEERKKGAPGGNWFMKLRPTLKQLAKTEDREGYKVHVMKLKLPKQAADFAKELENLFGPKWDEVRFAIAGKNVVVAWGSNTELLDQTLKNMKEGKPGLGASKHLAGFYKTSNTDRRAEMHFAVGPLMALFDAGPGGLPKAAEGPLSSFGLEVEPDSLQLNFWLPIGESRLLANVLKL